MPSLEQRLLDLEQRLAAKHHASCFWCECERDEKAARVPCTHGDWKPIPHETALAELA
jgi:hypothetical protein